MNKLLATYDLGLNVIMVRYNVRYLHRFEWDRYADAGRGICQSLIWMVEDLVVLTPEIVDSESSRELARTIGKLQLQRVAGQLYLADGDRPLEQVRRLFRELEGHARAALRCHPRLYRWFRLGKTLGYCLTDLLHEERAERLPSWNLFIRAAANLRPARADTINVLKGLRAQGGNAGLRSPLAVLQEVLAEAETNLDVWAPHVAIIPKLFRLDQRIKDALSQAPDPPMLQVCFDCGNQRALLDGKPYPINFPQALILSEICKADGKVVSSSKMIATHPSLNSANISSQVENLPREIEELIDRMKGRKGGFALRD